jgi:serine/threonine-protein kinase
MTTGLVSAADALRVEEAQRTREALRLGWVVALGVGIAVVLSPGDPAIRAALLVTLAAGLVGSLVMQAELARPESYSPARMHLIAIAALASGFLGILYVGVFSAAPIPLALGLYFFCRTESRPAAIATYAIAAGGHLVLAALIITGVFDDPGFYPVASDASVQVQIVGQILTQFAYGLSFWLARVTRRTSLHSIEQLQRATRLAAQRDVQLAELRNDLDRALQVGGPGRFTGVTVGSWQLGIVIGRGSMGEVYAATHTEHPDREAAVKLLRRELLADSRSVERFTREIAAASAIDAPNVVRVLEASTAADRIPFLAMEKLDGTTLAAMLRAGEPLDLATITSMLRAIANALELARAAGIVHRDVKPQNIMRTHDTGGTWKLLDFGVALLADTSGTLTRGGAVGTPAYMSPEQARGDAVDHRTDVYALGAVLYRCITGRAPFVRPDTPALLYAVVHELPPRADTTPAIARVLDRALAKAPAERFQTAREMVSAFEAAIAS